MKINKMGMIFFLTFSWLVILVAAIFKLNQVPYQGMLLAGLLLGVVITFVVMIDVIKNKHPERNTWLILFVVVPSIAPLIYLISKPQKPQIVG